MSQLNILNVFRVKKCLDFNPPHYLLLSLLLVRDFRGFLGVRGGGGSYLVFGDDVEHVVVEVREGRERALLLDVVVD